MAGIIDRIINWLKPTSQADNQPQAFHGGSTADRYFGGSFSSGGKWPNSISNPGSGLFLSHYALRQGARVAMQESPQGRAIVERKVDAIAGTGIKLEPTPDISVLGITQDAAAAWAKDVSARFHLWAMDKRQHRSEIMNFYQSQRFYAWSKERDNDVFVRLYYSPDKSLQNPLQFEFIDADQVRGYAYTTSYGFQANQDGIIRDERGRETGFKIWVKQKDGTYKDVEVKAKGPKSGRVFMLHGFRPEYAGQGRGYTKLAPILQDLENFTDFSLAHIKQAINQAMPVGWIEPSADEDTIPIFDNNLTTAGVGPAGSNFSNEATADDDASLVSDVACYSLPEASFNVPGSLFIQSLTKGAKIKLANPNSPGTGYDKFQDAFLSAMSVVSGMPLEMVFMKFGNSFSASRATLLLAYRVIEVDRADNDAEYHNPVEEMWLAGEIAAGRVSAPGWSDPRLRAAWLKSTWRGAPVPDIDPGKLAKATRDNLEIGKTNIERESQLHTGMSAVDNIEINNRIFENYKILPFTQGAIQAEAIEEKEED
jgi:capsid protein